MGCEVFSVRYWHRYRVLLLLPDFLLPLIQWLMFGSGWLSELEHVLLESRSAAVKPTEFKMWRCQRTSAEHRPVLWYEDEGQKNSYSGTFKLQVTACVRCCSALTEMCNDAWVMGWKIGNIIRCTVGACVTNTVALNLTDEDYFHFKYVCGCQTYILFINILVLVFSTSVHFICECCISGVKSFKFVSFANTSFFAWYA